MEDIIFTFSEDVKITIKQIEKIDTQLKNKIKATFTGKDYLDRYFISYPRITIEL